ncbi:XRE family transcriptional regulator [Clostridium sp. chh4-2]|uniref:helix-turn-helix domain-containing protein n=1 Tax=Clostridium sp. chh4-2 TaxID=2067550 RepID=UPI000CCF2817|nr:helix-turn-helix transcriptional regulator [Clostridium sp. chh4-2]PNV59999.1 XRE family transcriptional regulator [Clostridium sp. chh4-2]
MQNSTDIIRELREENELKQIQVAKILGITQQSYSNYETGAHEFPSRHLVKLSEFYGVTTDYLLGKTEYRQYVSDLNKPLVNHTTIGDFLSLLMSLDKENRKHLISYANYLHTLNKKEDN